MRSLHQLVPRLSPFRQATGANPGGSPQHSQGTVLQTGQRNRGLMRISLYLHHSREASLLAGLFRTHSVHTGYSITPEGNQLTPNLSHPLAGTCVLSNSRKIQQQCGLNSGLNHRATTFIPLPTRAAEICLFPSCQQSPVPVHCH